MTKANIYLVSALILVALAFIGGTFTGKKFFSKVVQKTEVQYVDRPILKRDTVTVVRPVERIVYKQVTDTVKVTIAVPKDFKGVGVIPPTPIKFKSQNVVLTYYNWETGTFVQDIYRVPPKVTYGIGPYIGLNPLRLDGFAEFGLEGDVRYKSLKAYSRLYTITSGGIFFTFGLQLDLWNRR